MATETDPNKYEIAGLDDRGRGFNRQAEMKYCNGYYEGILQYEKLYLTTASQKSERAAVLTLVRQLHEKGYIQLRTRIHFRGTRYLGNQELWEEHPDPASRNPFSQLAEWFREWWDKQRDRLYKK